MRLGFVGTGTIAAAMVDGLRGAGAAFPILLSPRNQEVAAGLAAKYPDVRIAESNQAVLDGSDLVVLAVRPQIVDAVLNELRFREDHHICSLVAAVSLDYLHNATRPAVRVTRAVPIPSVARRQGPTAFYPPDDRVGALFDLLGTAIPLVEEAQFDTFTAVTGVMASYFAFAGTISGWMETQGVEAGKARAYVAQMLQGLAAADPRLGFEALADEHQTRGGLNEQVLRAMHSDGAFISLEKALDSVLTRLQQSVGR